MKLHHPWDSPGKNTGVGCHFLLQCIKVKSKSEVAQLCPTLSDPMDCSLPGSSVHGIFQARVLEWVAIAFSNSLAYNPVTVRHPELSRFREKEQSCQGPKGKWVEGGAVTADGDDVWWKCFKIRLCCAGCTALQIYWKPLNFLHWIGEFYGQFNKTIFKSRIFISK